MQNAECRVQNAECRMQSAECRMLNAECRMLNAECGMQRIQKPSLVREGGRQVIISSATPEKSIDNIPTKV